MSPSNNPVGPSASGSDEITDYEKRLPHAKPGDTLRGMYFNAVFNAVKSAAGEQALSQFRQSLKDPELTRRFIDFSNYPVTDFLKLAAAATKLLAPHVGGQENAQRHIGKQAVTDFFTSMVGKTLLLLSGDSPVQVLSRLPSGYSTSVNWGERSVTILSEHSARVSYRSGLMPPCHNEGSLMGILQAAKAKNPQVRSYAKGVLDCDCEVTWE